MLRGQRVNREQQTSLGSRVECKMSIPVLNSENGVLNTAYEYSCSCYWVVCFGLSDADGDPAGVSRWSFCIVHRSEGGMVWCLLFRCHGCPRYPLSTLVLSCHTSSALCLAVSCSTAVVAWPCEPPLTVPCWCACGSCRCCSFWCSSYLLCYKTCVWCWCLSLVWFSLYAPVKSGRVMNCIGKVLGVYICLQRI